MHFFRPLLAWLVLVVPISTLADDFRGSAWGDSIGQVLKQEKAKVVDKADDSLFYEGRISGIDVYIMYGFLHGRLVEAAYFNRQSYMNKNAYLEDYKKLKDLLIKKYGKPENDQVVWRNDLYRDDPSGWGTAVSIGHLVFRAAWSTDTTTIVTALKGENFEVNHGILYSEKASKEKMEKQEQEKALDQL